VSLPPVKISLDIPNILCYTFQFVRRFCSSEEPNYTPTGKNGQYFILLFLIIFSISLSDKVFYFTTNHIRLEIYLPPS
uniref:hypothetical protein n=1 Tax=Neisseria meningitidis TaxID=487 RepID=UPI00195CCC67